MAAALDGDFMMRKACPVSSEHALVVGYDVINRAPFRVSLGRMLPSRAHLCFAEIL